MKNKQTAFILAMILGLLSHVMKAQNTEWGKKNKALFAAVTHNGNTGYVQKSTDGGKNWVTVWDGSMEAKSSQNRLFGITHGNGVIVAVGNSIVSSKDGGQTWTETHMLAITGNQFFTGRSPLRGVAYGDGMFVAAGPFQIVYSTDGINWSYFDADGAKSSSEVTKKSSTASVGGTKNKLGKLKGLKSGGLKGFAKSGAKSLGNDNATNSSASTHGKKPVGNFPSNNSPGLKTPLDVEFINGKFYIMGGNMAMAGQVFSVENNELKKEQDIAFTGNAASLNTGGLKAVASDNGQTIVAVSNSTKTTYSVDGGNTWKYAYNPGKNQGWGIAYGNGKFVAADPFQGVFVTENIASGWEYHKRTGGRGNVNDLIFANDRFIIVGNDGFTLVSPDGITWEKASVSTNYGFHLMRITYVEL